MVVQVRVKNFLSICDEQVFSLVAANGILEKNSLLNENLVAVDEQLSLVKAAVVYGANASGKSNLLKAIAFLATALSEAPPDGLAVEDYQPFVLSRTTSDAPTLLEVVFLVNGVRYRYGFEVLRQHVVSEWFYVWRKQETVVFHRTPSELQIGRSYPKLRELQNKGMINSAALLANLGALFNDESCLLLKGWAQKVSYFDPIRGMNNLLLSLQHRGRSKETVGYLRDPEGKQRVLELLRMADLSIDDVEVVEEKSALGSMLRDRELSPVTNPRILSVRKVWEPETRRFRSVTAPLFEFESQGTQKLFCLIGMIFRVLDEGGLLVADDLGAKLHPLLTQRIGQLFNQRATNPRNAQFVFSTHDTSLLSAGLFRRDQIWFTEKDLKGETRLYALTDYFPGGRTVRNDEQLEKNYMAGKYGGVPYLGDFDNLLETTASQSGADE